MSRGEASATDWSMVAAKNRKASEGGNSAVSSDMPLKDHLWWAFGLGHLIMAFSMTLMAKGLCLYGCLWLSASQKSSIRFCHTLLFGALTYFCEPSQGPIWSIMAAV